MQHKISAGITKITLSDRRERASSRFPLFLTQLRSLCELNLDKDGHSMPYYREIPQHVQSLSSTIKKLKIRVKDSRQIIFAPTATETDESNSDAPSSVESNHIQPSWTFASAFPHLESLELDSVEEWNPSDFALLPSSLTSLTLSLSTEDTLITHGEEMASSLPRQLLKLKIRDHPTLLPSFWPCLPPHLTKLCTHHSQNWSGDDYYSLPDLSLKHLNSLTHLKGSFTGCLSLSDLPATITSLDMAWIKDFDASLLQSFTGLKTLKRLDQLTPELLRSLPPSVESIFVSQLATTSTDMNKLWPPSLTILEAGYTSDWSKGAYPASYFPSSGITFLTIPDCIDLSLVATFPSTLGTLIMERPILPASLDNIVFPPHLTHLVISAHHNDNWDWVSVADPIKVADDDLPKMRASLHGKKVIRCFPYNKLPQSLKHLSLSGIVPASQLKHLPPRLTHLSILDIFQDADFAPTDALEMSAMRNVFEIGRAEGIESDSFDWTQLKRASIPALLPRTLTSLKLQGDAMVLAKPDWSMLPPHLESFTCHPYRGIPGHSLREIPMKRMKEIGIKAKKVEDHHLELIPRSLQILDFFFRESHNLTPAAFEYVNPASIGLDMGHDLEELLSLLIELQEEHADEEDPSYFLRLLRPDEELINALLES